MKSAMTLSAHELSEHWQTVFSRRLCVGISDHGAQPETLFPAEQLIFSRLPVSRQGSWLLGRSALKTVLKTIGLDPDTSQLSWPHPFLSLTHSGSIAIAVACQDPCSGIGIDLECHRQIPQLALSYYLNAAETETVRTQADALRLWTVKEAIFKAYPNNDRTILSSYEVLDGRQHRGQSISQQSKDGEVWTYDSVCLGQDYLSLSLLTGGLIHDTSN